MRPPVNNVYSPRNATQGIATHSEHWQLGAL